MNFSGSIRGVTRGVTQDLPYSDTRTIQVDQRINYYFDVPTENLVLIKLSEFTEDLQFLLALADAPFTNIDNKISGATRLIYDSDTLAVNAYGIEVISRGAASSYTLDVSIPTINSLTTSDTITDTDRVTEQDTANFIYFSITEELDVTVSLSNIQRSDNRGNITAHLYNAATDAFIEWAISNRGADSTLTETLAIGTYFVYVIGDHTRTNTRYTLTIDASTP